MPPLQKIAACRARSQTERDKEMPPIPAAIKHRVFSVFSQADRVLALWHLSYKTVECHPAAKKPALEWVMERQSVITDKDSGITNVNLWATETMGNAKCPLELFLRVITVSLETMKVVVGLPKLEIDSKSKLELFS